MLIAAIVVECAVAVVAVLGALKGRPHLYGFALTFARTGVAAKVPTMGVVAAVAKEGAKRPG